MMVHVLSGLVIIGLVVWLVLEMMESASLRELNAEYKRQADYWYDKTQKTLDDSIKAVEDMKVKLDFAIAEIEKRHNEKLDAMTSMYAKTVRELEDEILKLNIELDKNN